MRHSRITDDDRLPFQEVLRCRVRYYSDGLFLENPGSALKTRGQPLKTRENPGSALDNQLCTS